jgi:hypothetical protein
MIVDFYNKLIRKVEGFKGFIMTGSLDDPQKAIKYIIRNKRRYG